MGGGEAGVLGLLFELLVARQTVLQLDSSVVQNFDPENLIGFDINIPIDSNKIKVVLQYCDTDITIKTESGLTIIQCKASSDPSNPITLSDLKQIFVDAAKQLIKIREKDASRTLDQFLLISNRKLSKTLKTLEDELNGLTSENADRFDRPNCLGNGSANKTMSKWATSLKDIRRSKSGDHPKVKADQANAVVEILSVFKYVHLSFPKCENAFRQSCKKLGLNEGEIDRVHDKLQADLLQATTNGGDIRNALQGHFWSEGYHTLCPKELKSIEEAQIQKLWNQSDLKGLPTNDQPFLLPRPYLAEEFEEHLETMKKKSEYRSVVLLGPGGVGKTEFLFKVPKIIRDFETDSEMKHLFCFVEHEPNSTLSIKKALNPFFATYKYDKTDLLDRLFTAAGACEEIVTVWIICPNTDEIKAPEFKSLITEINDKKHQLRVKFVISARMAAWGNLSRYKPDMLMVKVGWFEKNDLEGFLAKIGVKIPSILDSTMRYSRGVQSTTIVEFQADFRYFEHPLLYTALAQQLTTMSEDDWAPYLIKLIEGETNTVEQFKQDAQKMLCERAHKRCSNDNIDLQDINLMYRRLSESRGQLKDLTALQLHAQCDAFADSSKTDIVLQEFTEIGILSKDYNNRYKWELAI